MKTLLRFSRVIALIMLPLGVTLLVKEASAQGYKVIHTFNGSDGAIPSSLTIDASGNLYGTTIEGGSSNDGTVYKLSRSGSAWTLTTLYEFKGGNDGITPDGKVVFGPDGALYGTTVYGGGTSCMAGLLPGCGTVFKLKPSATVCHSVQCPWTETILYRFAGGADGAWPFGEVIFDKVGNIFGSTEQGGTGACGGNCGTVYELSPSQGGWTESQLYSFSGGSDGANPITAVTFSPQGELYGTTHAEGSGFVGTAFQMMKSGGGWMESPIHQFGVGGDGGKPASALLLDSMGNLYGATITGNLNGSGDVFELTPSGGVWTETVLHAFDAATKTGPIANIARDNSGNIYGTTYGNGTLSCAGEGCGTIFELARSGAGWTYVLLYTFPGGNDGEHPRSNIVFDSKGNLFGTASQGGANGDGVVFEIQAVDTLFSDLGPPGNLYQCCVGWTIAGSQSVGTSFTAANLFTVSGGGNFDITQIDLGVDYGFGSNAIYASIWTDNGGVPGTQVANAYWGNLAGVSCCDLITIPVSGVTLTGGQSYFMIVGPMDLSGTTFEAWNWNNQGVNGLDLYSNDGGNTWHSDGSGQPLGAFDVIGMPQ